MQMIPFALAAASTVTGVMGARQESKALQQQFQAKAEADRYNAAVKRQQAEAINRTYGAREEQQRRAAAIQAGGRRAAMAQSGIGLDSFDTLEHQNQVFAEMDALNIRYEGLLESKGMLNSANVDDMSAASNMQSASNAKKAGRINMASAIFSGASKMYGAAPASWKS